MYLMLWIFFAYAFLGWCTEVSFAALVSGKFVNRGFLNGPVCPIYGFGVVIVLAFLEPLRHNLLLLFLGSVLLTSALEWVTGFALEKIFHQRWWDYSNEPFNLGGYICLRFSIAWGLACLFVVKILHPSILLAIRLIPKPVGIALLVILSLIMAVDLVATVRTIAKINRSLGQIDELAAKIKSASNEFGENLADKVLDVAEKSADFREELADRSEDFRENLADLKEDLTDHWEERQMDQAIRRAERQESLEELRRRLSEVMDQSFFGQRRLLSAFPQMRSLDHKQALEQLRRRMEQLREERKR
ncbi:hypothetical protein DWX58_12220 [Pseudoflavonifractor sp. AF19-9AC]|uniref:putative ABC transporter permease n=1 Tax=Pseudoflavonifractor sp. AF19-9AC TaxID=2292244 RepID=UPI000E5061BE|nr:putative ABC transporter permease [Pseudoflavonifractor sp. AF19-9AC]RHR06718.1 hypothetical protein DWX58_12220 [Pseudoflavonifractor sp. AF19-9AC]